MGTATSIGPRDPGVQLALSFLEDQAARDPQSVEDALRGPGPLPPRSVANHGQIRTSASAPSGASAAVSRGSRPRGDVGAAGVVQAAGDRPVSRDTERVSTGRGNTLSGTGSALSSHRGSTATSDRSGAGQELPRLATGVQVVHETFDKGASYFSCGQWSRFGSLRMRIRVR